MKVVVSTQAASKILKEMRGNAAYWLERIETDGLKAAIEAYRAESTYSDEDIKNHLLALHADSTTALQELGENIENALTPTPPSLSAS